MVRYKSVWSCDLQPYKTCRPHIGCETEEKLGSNIEIRERGFHTGGEVALMSTPQWHLARTVPQVHDHMQLGVQRNSGNCDHGEAGGSRQEVRDRTGELCEINGARRQRQCSGLRYRYLHSVTCKYLPQHPILKHPQPVFSKYKKNFSSVYFNCIFFKTNGKADRPRDYEKFSLLLIFH